MSKWVTLKAKSEAATKILNKYGPHFQVIFESDIMNMTVSKSLIINDGNMVYVEMIEFGVDKRHFDIMESWESDD